eukprot:6490419-Amphidinium_carterae.11
MFDDPPAEYAERYATEVAPAPGLTFRPEHSRPQLHVSRGPVPSAGGMLCVYIPKPGDAYHCFEFIPGRAIVLRAVQRLEVAWTRMLEAELSLCQQSESV